MNELEKLKQENKELKYQVKIRDDMSCDTCRGFGTVMIAIDDGMDCPRCAQEIADIKADAIIAMANEEMTVGRMHNDTMRSFVFVSDIHDYAEKLRNKNTRSQ
jgi:hypothetical protein